MAQSPSCLRRRDFRLQAAGDEEVLHLQQFGDEATHLFFLIDLFKIIKIKMLKIIFKFGNRRINNY